MDPVSYLNHHACLLMSVNVPLDVINRNLAPPKEIKCGGDGKNESDSKIYFFLIFNLSKETYYKD